MEAVAHHPSLPVGFCFRPTDEQLVVFYLRRHISGEPLPAGFVVPADVYGTEPWNLVGKGQEEGYYFARRVRTSAKARRPSRVAGTGSWQAFKKDEEIKSSVDGNGLVTVGVKHCLAYKCGRRNNVGWIMYEYVPSTVDQGDEFKFQEHVLCHIKKSNQAKKRMRGEEDHPDQLYRDDTGCNSGATSTSSHVAEQQQQQQQQGEDPSLPPAQQQLPMASWSGHDQLTQPYGYHDNSMITTADNMEVTTELTVVEEMLAEMDGETQQELEPMQLPAALPNYEQQHERSVDQWQQGNQLVVLEQGTAATTSLSPNFWIQQQLQLEQFPLGLETGTVATTTSCPSSWIQQQQEQEQEQQQLQQQLQQQQQQLQKQEQLPLGMSLADQVMPSWNQVCHAFEQIQQDHWFWNYEASACMGLEYIFARSHDDGGAPPAPEYDDGGGGGTL